MTKSKSIPVDTKLYQHVKQLADAKFLSKTGIYKSAWIVRTYKKLGGKYITRDGENKKPTGLKRWFDEQWVDLNRPIYDKDNKTIIGFKPCGRPSVSSHLDKLDTLDELYPLCRPTYKITEDTPTTYKQLTKAQIELANQRKQKLQHKGRLSKISDIKPRL